MYSLLGIVVLVRSYKYVQNTKTKLATVFTTYSVVYLLEQLTHMRVAGGSIPTKQVFFLRLFLMFNVHVNKCSVMSGRFLVFIGLTNSKKCEGHNSDSAGSEPRTCIPLIPSLTLKWPFFLFSLGL